MEPLADFWRGNINLSMLQMWFFFFLPFSILGEENGFFFSALFNVTATKRCCWYSTDPLAAQPSGNLLPSLVWPLHTSIFLAALFIQQDLLCPALWGFPGCFPGWGEIRITKGRRWNGLDAFHM